MSKSNGLPKGWRRMSLSDICEKITDGTHHSPPQEQQTHTGDFLYITAKNIKEYGVELSNVTYVPESVHRPIYDRCNPEPGDVLYIKDGVTTGIATVNQLDQEFSLLSSVALLKPRRDVIDSRFLKWYLNGPVGYHTMTSQMGGTAIKRLTVKKIKEGSVIVAPLDEQRRIVAKIEELFSDLDAGVAALKRAKANLKRYRAAVLKAAVEGKLTEQWRADHPDTEPADQLLALILTERRQRWEQDQLARYKAQGKQPPKGWKDKYKEPAKPDTSELPKLPKGWCWASVDQCSADKDYAITDGPFGSNLKSSHYSDAGPRVIRLQNIGDGRFVDEIAHISEEHFETLKRHSVDSGDVVTAMLGETLPRACIVPSHVTPAIVKADCVKVSPHLELILPHYLSMALNAHQTRTRAATKIAGVGRPRLNLQKLKPLPIPLPPIAEQSSLVSQIEATNSQVDVALIAIDHDMHRAVRLRQSILKRAFSGTLNTDPSRGEPIASTLFTSK